MKEIPLTQGQVALVDDEDFEELMKHKWHARKDKKNFYAQRNSPKDEQGKQHAILMHRVIMNAPKGMEVDHIDSNGLNNIRANLRVCTKAQNQMNARRRCDNTSGFKGVCFFKPTNKWMAQISINNKNLCLGYFKNPELAYEAYCEACVKYRGEYANLG